MANLTCAYQNCGEPINHNLTSYSGYSHVAGAGGGPDGWQHWASLTPYGPGEAETQRIMLPCHICALLGPDNPDHVSEGGHMFIATDPIVGSASSGAGGK